MVAPITFGGGITIGGGISGGPDITVGPAPSPTPGGANGAISMAEMTATGNISSWLQGGGTGNATMTANGFIITGNTGNPGASNGVAIASLTANNKTFFSTYGTGNKTVTWGAGSTFNSGTVLLQTNNTSNPDGTAQLVFFLGNIATPATFNFPITFS